MIISEDDIQINPEDAKKWKKEMFKLLLTTQRRCNLHSQQGHGGGSGFIFFTFFFSNKERK